MGCTYEYGARYCKGCNSTHYYKIKVASGSRDAYRPVEFACPDCGSNLGLLDAGLELTVLGGRPGDEGWFHCRLGDANMENLDQLLGALRLYRMLIREMETPTSVGLMAS